MKILILFLLSFSVYANDFLPPPKKSPDIYNTYNTYVNASGTALALAVAAPQYDLNVDAWQIGIGGGLYKGPQGRVDEAFAIGLGKRIGTHGILNFSGGREDTGGEGLNIGFTWKL